MAVFAAEAEVLPAHGTVFEYEGEVYTVGRPVDDVGIHHLPLGTTVWEGTGLSGRWFTKTAEGNQWTRSDRNGRRGASRIAGNYNVFRSFPGGPSVPTSFVEYRARFADAVRAVAARYSDTHLALAEEILDRLGVNDPVSGAAVFYRTPGTEGQIAVFGEPDQERFTIFRHDGTDWRKVHGWYDSMKDAGQCRLTTGGKQVEDDEAEIARFKDAVWAAGSKAKQDHRWCSAYDRVLADFDIVDPDPRPDFSAWDTLMKGVEARDNAPDGTVLAGDRGDWGIFVKENGDWVRKAGTRPLAAGTMRVLFDGAGALRIPNAAVLKPFLPGAAWQGDTLIGWE